MATAGTYYECSSSENNTWILMSCKNGTYHFVLSVQRSAMSYVHFHKLTDMAASLWLAMGLMLVIGVAWLVLKAEKRRSGKKGEL
jgi:hypothetical protein